MMWLAAILSLTIALDEAGPVRLATSGTGDDVVTWSLAGNKLATTDDWNPAEVTLPSGAHVLWVQGPDGMDWRILARSALPGNGEAKYVPAWTAAYLAPLPSPNHFAAVVYILTALGVAIGRGRSLLEANDPANLA